LDDLQVVLAAWLRDRIDERADRIRLSVVKAHRLYAQIDTENAASIALAEKLGFSREGHQRLDTLIRGEWRDTLIYARLSLID